MHLHASLINVRPSSRFELQAHFRRLKVGEAFLNVPDRNAERTGDADRRQGVVHIVHAENGNAEGIIRPIQPNPEFHPPGCVSD